MLTSRKAVLCCRDGGERLVHFALLLLVVKSRHVINIHHAFFRYIAGVYDAVALNVAIFRLAEAEILENMPIGSWRRWQRGDHY